MPRGRPRQPHRWTVAVLAVALASALGAFAAAAQPRRARAASASLTVVALENFWGSLARQLAGSRAAVRSIIVDPSSDPHSYQPTAADGIAIATSQMVIVNGIGYDDWGPRLLAANPNAGRLVLNVGRMLGLAQGDNPHQWYSPVSVARVIDRITADFQRLDPKDAGYFAARRRALLGAGFARYDGLLAAIRRRYAGVPVGYSESIFQPLGRYLGLRLPTPYSFARAIAEGTDVTAQDKQTVDAQVQRRDIKAWVVNSQNLTPDVQRVSSLARAAHIPIVTITETLDPPSASFEQWQASELEGLARALHAATGR